MERREQPAHDLRQVRPIACRAVPSGAASNRLESQLQREIARCNRVVTSIKSERMYLAPADVRRAL